MTTTAQDQNPRDLTPLPLRAHTILGVCEAIGEDFHINPLWIRVPLAAGVLVSPLYAVLAYLALGLIVLTTRLVFPNSKIAPQAVDGVTDETEDRERDLPLAA